MLRRLVRFSARVAVAAAAVWIARSALKWWVDGPDVEPSSKPWPPVGGASAPADRSETTASSASTPPQTTPAPGSERPAEKTAAETSLKARPSTPESEGSPKTTRKAAAAKEAAAPPPGARWVKPDDGGATPASHPVKAKLRSRLYHLPGMVAYARTVPDRCYPTLEAAEEDGFKPAQR